MCEYLEGFYDCIRFILRIWALYFGARRNNWTVKDERGTVLYETDEEVLTSIPTHSREGSGISSRKPRTLRNQSMDSESNINMPAKTVEEMEDFIEDEMLRQKYELPGKPPFSLKEFMPITTLRSIINKDAVENVLQDSRKKFETPINDLAQWFSTKAFRLFGILVRKNQLSLVQHMYNQRIHDGMLPIRFEWLPQEGRRKPYEVTPFRTIGADDSITDEMINEETRLREAFRCGSGSPWNRDPEQGVYLFYDLWQAPFLSPVFTEKQFEYKFDKKVCLPFTSLGKTVTTKNAVFSTVQQASVHVDHLPKIKGNAIDPDGNPSVAIKKLREIGDDFESIARGEASVLKLMKNELSHMHLIKTIAYYRVENEHYFMFPWAEEGNLWSFWRNNKPSTSQKYITWVFRQLAGLTEAIEKLHHGDKELGLNSNCRHGDLKPENILCFKSTEHRESNPVLVITDVGLARTHDQATALRKETIRLGATARYAPPELDINPETPKSRRFDVWSLGCIYFEFVIWLLYGFEKLEKFYDLVNPYYKVVPLPVGSRQTLDPNVQQKNGKTAELHDKFEDWISYMTTKDWRCSEGTAIRRLITLIHTRMLKTTLLLPEHINKNNPQSPTAEQQHANSNPQEPLRPPASKPQSGHLVPAPAQTIKDTVIAEQNLASNTPGVVVSSAAEGPEDVKPFGRKGRTFTNLVAQTSGDELLDDPRIRAYAPQVKKVLKEILASLEQGSDGIEAVGDRPFKDPPGPSTEGKVKSVGNELAPETTKMQNEYNFAPLDDNWDYSSDEIIAKEVFSDLDLSTILPTRLEFSPLCVRCSNLDLSSEECDFWDSLGELQYKIENEGCSLCQLLSQSLQNQLDSQRRYVRFARVSSYLTIDDGLGRAIANIYTTPEAREASLEDTQLGFPKLPKAGDPTHLKILNAWVRFCDENHECCPKDIDFRPTRLLNVGNEHSDAVKLQDCGHGQLGSKNYIALSHRWGLAAQHHPFCTTRSNIEEFKTGIDVASLPKTFQDAIRITRGLGLHFLWIDSLCIIQDDHDDWETESKFMEQVFSSAYCTIAASCASGSSDGFLKPRPERQCVTMRTQDDNTPYYVCEVIDNFDRDVDQSGLNQRGWVLQERALSRRAIFFAETQSYWECGGGVRCESMTTMKNRKASFLGESEFSKSAKNFVKGMRIEFIKNIFERYSKLALTYQSDRPVAIKGLERRLLNTFNSTGGYGIVDKYLHRCLLWQRAADTLRRIPSFRKGYYPPSWSWMAYAGPIGYMPVPFGEASWNGDDILSPFSNSRSIQIKGTDASDIDEVLELEAHVSRVMEWNSKQVIFDEQDHRNVDPLLCVVIGKSKGQSADQRREHYVVLVRPLMESDEEHIYERVGVATLEEQQIDFEGRVEGARIR